MPATVSTIVRPAMAGRASAFAQLLGACWEIIAGYFIRRSAIATLHELDDRALRDIGLSRSQIEAAVHGVISLSDRARM